MEKENEYMKKLMAKIDGAVETGMEMARNEPAVNELVRQALETDKACQDREKFITFIIQRAFALGATVQGFNEAVKQFETTEQEMYEINETTDYKAFHFLRGGRVPTEERIQKLMATIKKVGYIPSPVIVNENMEIVDGACRVKACERLALPVYYIIQKKAGIAESIALNS